MDSGPAPCGASRNDGRRAFARSPHQNIAELPGIAAVDVLGKQPRPVVERRPVGIKALHRTEIRPLDFQAAAEIHLVGFDDAGGRVFQRPDHAREHGATTPACRWRSGRAQILRVSSIESCEPYQ